MDGEGEFQDVKRKKKTKKSKVKSLQTSKSGSDSMNTITIPPIPKPLFKAPILKDSPIFLWNGGGKRRLLLQDVTPPKSIVIEKVTIYIQKLSSDQAKTLGIIGWDNVLADIEGLKAEIAERRIANFWASCRHSLLMTQKSQSQKAKDGKSTNPDPTAAAAGSSNPTSSAVATPSGYDSKRKCTSTPSSAEPVSKHLYLQAVGYNEVVASKKRLMSCGSTPIM